MAVVITFGTFDVLHIGHVRLLERARALGSRLVVGVSSDQLNRSKKGRDPVYPESDRFEIIRALRCVDDVFTEHSLEDKALYIMEWKADILVMGNDWQGRFDHLRDICEVVYLPRTEGVSTTDVIAEIRKYE